MVSDDECYQLMNDLNQARQAIGKVIDHTNSLAANIDFEDFQGLALQFRDFDYNNFVKAIALAVKAARDMIAMPGVNAWNVNINVKPQIQAQCHNMRRAMDAAKIDNTPKLPEAKPVELTGPEWLAQRFAEFYAAGKMSGNFAPIWSKQVYGETLPELTALNRALGAHPGFEDGPKDIARRETTNIFIGSIYATAKVDGINTAKTWHEDGQTFQDIVKPNPNPTEPSIKTSPERDALAERIREHNATSTTKFTFDVAAEWHRARSLAAIHAYARLVLAAEPKPEPQAIPTMKFITTLEEI